MMAKNPSTPAFPSAVTPHPPGLAMDPNEPRKPDSSDAPVVQPTPAEPIRADHPLLQPEATPPVGTEGVDHTNPEPLASDWMATVLIHVKDGGNVRVTRTPSSDGRQSVELSVEDYRYAKLSPEETDALIAALQPLRGQPSPSAVSVDENAPPEQQIAKLKSDLASAHEGNRNLVAHSNNQARLIKSYRGTMDKSAGMKVAGQTEYDSIGLPKVPGVF